MISAPDPDGQTADLHGPLLHAAHQVLTKLRDPEHLRRQHHADENARPHPGPTIPLDPTIIDVRARAAAMLGTPNQDAADAVWRIYAQREVIGKDKIAAALPRVARATGAGRVFLAERRGHTPLFCPACGERSVILLEEEPGILECQNDACAPALGAPLRRYTVQTIGYGDPDALVSLAEAEQYTRVKAATWAERFRRSRIKPAGKRRTGR